ncbi:MAG: flagellar protein FlaG [Treponema sp.]|jgi:flagellar protein FlaG|nr:flagellar protein FlaG [Treponema sp.]
MGMQMGLGGNAGGLVQNKGSSRRLQSRPAGRKAVIIEKNERTLPGNRELLHKQPVNVQKSAKDLEQVGLAFNKKLKLKADRQSHEVTVKVIDPETDKVIKELPSIELQRDRIGETIGILFDEQV